MPILCPLTVLCRAGQAGQSPPPQNRRGRPLRVLALQYLNAALINDIAQRWIHAFDRGRVEALADLKRALEENPVPKQKPEFIYQPYIRTRPPGSGRR